MQPRHFVHTLAALALVSVSADAAPQGLPRVAIAAAAANSLTACPFTDMQTKLMLTGRFAAVDLIDVVNATPELTVLDDYAAVITWSDTQYDDSVALGEHLAAYVDQGGGVVVAGFATFTSYSGTFLGGRWLTGAYEVIRHTAGLQSGPASLGAVLDPSHPVARNVNSLSGMLVARPFLTANWALNQGRVLLEWNDGRMLAAVSSVHPKRVDLGFVPVTTDCVNNYIDSSGDLMTLVANALEFAATGGTLGTSYCVAMPNSSGQAASLLINGSARVVDNDLELRAIGMPLGTNGYFLCSRVQGFVSNPGGSQGNLCLGSGIGRFLQQVQNSGTSGSIAIQANLLALPTSMGPIAAQAGQTWSFQAWFRDANPQLTSNFSRGASILLQ
jgi:hypothetical protein